MQNLEVLNLEVNMSKSKSSFGVILLIVFVTFLLLIKVYISNKIYFISRDIQKISTKIDALKEERSILKLKIEKLNFKYKVSDALFNYEIDKKAIKQTPQEGQKEPTNEKDSNTTTSTPAELFNDI